MAVLLLCTALVAAACGGDDSGSGTPSEVTGVIVSIDSEGLDAVHGFELKDGDETYDILIADDIDYGFPLGHLNEHRATAQAVTVKLEERDGDLYALSIEDA